MLNNIPVEMKALRQWVCFRYETLANGKQTKIPVTITGHSASVTDSATWIDFNSAAQHSNKFDGIGFVLTEADPFCIIDLDNKPHAPCTPEQLARHQKIYEMFDSYTEYSTSGTGIHIIVKGRIPAGVHRDNVEVYSSARYMVCTGNVLRNAPIQDYQELLSMLYGEMRPQQTSQLLELESAADDNQIVDMAINAVNSEKFNALCSGDMTGYPSQSEADFALLAIIAFYTQSNEQVRRIFRMTALGKREKAVRNNTYLDFAIGKIRAQQPAPIDMTQVTANAQALINQRPKVKEVPHSPQPKEEDMETHEKLADMEIPLPPGLIGELAVYFYQAAIRPVPEIALCAAIAVVAGTCGRSYNISGSGLNQYLILLARTGSGKEGAASGIDALMAAVRPRMPMIDQFMGPAAFASGQALTKVLSDRPCFVSVLGEFGLTLQHISDQRASAPEKMLKKVLLDLYGKSGWNNTLRSSVYSDAEKNTKQIQAPCVTILGESTPETFFEGLDSSHIAEGLIPRFSIVEYKGPRPARNLNSGQPPNRDLVQKFSDLVTASITSTNNGKCNHVELDDHSRSILDAFDTKADRIMNASRGDVDLQLWNRAHLKALKLSALIAVGNNPYNPVVTSEVAQWAVNFVERDVLLVAGRFKVGDVGQGNDKQAYDLKRVIESYYNKPVSDMYKGTILEKLHSVKIVPYHYILRRVASVSSFKRDKLGTTVALKKSIQALLDSGALVEVPKITMSSTYGFSGVAYSIGSVWN